MTFFGTPRAPEPELDLSFPPRPEFVGTARHTVAALARLHGVAEHVVDDLKLAVSEACTNAVTLNGREGHSDDVRVLAALFEGSIVIEVFDSGPAMDLSLLDREADIDSEEFSFEYGLSLPVIMGLVDEVDIEHREPRGSVVLMRMAAPPEPPAA